MPLTATPYEHIVLDPSGVPLLAGTATKVVELVLEREAYGWSPEELHFQHPHLTLGQIYSALAYYADHRPALDEDLRQRAARVAGLRTALPEPPLAERLRRTLRDTRGDTRG